MSDEYEVERIMAQCRQYGQHQYLIAWMGYGADQDSWEPAQIHQHTHGAGVKGSRRKSQARTEQRHGRTDLRSKLHRMPQ